MSYPEQSNPQRWYGEERDPRYAEPPYADQRPSGEYRPPEPRAGDQSPAEPAWGGATRPDGPAWSGDQQSWNPPADQAPAAWDTPQPRATEGSWTPEQRPAEQSWTPEGRPAEAATGQSWTPDQRSAEQPGGQSWTPEQRPAEQAWTPAEQATGGQRHQAERVPLLKGQPRPEQPKSNGFPSEQPTSGGFPTEQPAFDPPTTRVPTVDPARGPEPGRGPEPARAPQPGYPTEPVQLRRPEPAADGDGVYRSRRPVIAIGLAAVVGVLEIAALVLLGSTLLANGTTSPSGVVAGVLLLLGLPVFAAGMYGMVTGAGRASERHGARVLLRPPLSYLVIGLVLLLGAALAAG
ncbi:hypothetical protein [Longispora urticae]